MNRKNILFLGMVLAGALAWADDPPLSFGFGAEPYYSVPVTQDSNLFHQGFGSAVFGDLAIPGTTFTAGIVADYNWISTINPQVTLSAVGVGARTTWALPLGGPFSAKVLASGGEYLVGGNQNQAGGGYSPWVQGGLGLDLTLGRSFVLSTQADYRYRFGWMGDFQLSLVGKFITAPVGPTVLQYQLKPGFTPLIREQRGLELSAYKAGSVYPVLAKYYADHGMGQVVLHNFEQIPAEGIVLKAEIKGYTTGPKTLGAPASLGPGEEAVIDLTALFDDQLMAVSDPISVPVTLTLTYVQDGRRISNTGSPGLAVKPRNSLAGDDDRQLAAFVSPADPVVTAFVKGTLASVREVTYPALSAEIQTAMAISEALRYRKVSLQRDSQADTAATGLETVKFARETLADGSGTKRDLAVLWCSLLEAQGIETAILKVPGGVLAAFALGASSDTAVTWWGHSKDFVVKDGKAWVPVDPSTNTQNFLGAWSAGADLTAANKDDLSLVSVREAWKTYPAAHIPDHGQALATEPAANLKTGMKAVLAAYFVRELTTRETAIKAALKKTSDPAEINLLENRLGILYARFGQYDHATDVFKGLVTLGFKPSMVNIGNTSLLAGQTKTAVAQFLTVLQLSKSDQAALTGLVLSYQVRGDQPQWNATIALLSKVNKAQSDRLLARNPTTDTLMPFILWSE